jgi:hypothetical protein
LDVNRNSGIKQENTQLDKIDSCQWEKKSCFVDFGPYTNKTGIFSKLKDLEYCKKFSIDPEIKTLV